MSSIDTRVVEAKFEYRQFEQGVKATLSALDTLKKGLTLPGATKGITDISAAANKVNLAGIGRGVDAIQAKFSTLSIVGITALTNITNKAVNAGTQLVKSFTVAPLLDGFHQYEQQINATGTILANVSASGATLKDVTKTLDEMNVYANKTIYSFSDMASNLGTFTSAGLGLKPAAAAIQGLSNVAAAAGAGTQQAAGAMYQLSQALGRGSVHAADWNSVVAAGMASANFKTALLETAKAMGTIKMPKTESIADWIKKGGNFQDAMSKGQITAGVLSQTLGVMTGNLTDAQLAQQGYTKEQIKSLQAMAAQAAAAATNVKTFTQLKDNLSQGVGSAWATVFKTIFGDINGATTLFTKMSEVLSKIFIDPVLGLNEFVKQFKAVGGLKNIGDGLKFIFSGVASVFKAVSSAFREIFPPTTVSQALALSATFETLAAHLKMGADTAANLKRTFAGVFAVFDIAKQVIGGAISALASLFGSMAGGSGGVLKFTAGIGDTLVAFDQMLKKSGAIKNFFTSVGNILAVPIHLLSSFADILGKLFSKFDTGKASGITSSFDSMGKKLAPLEAGIARIRSVFSALGRMLSSVGSVIGKSLVGIGQAIASFFTPDVFSQTLSVINTSLIGGIFLIIKKFFSGGLKIDVGGGFMGELTKTFSTLTDSLKVMQANVKADIILKIGAAIALLTASIVVLSMLDPKKLAQGLAGAALGLGIIGAAVVKLSSSIGLIGTAKLPFITGSILALSAALVLLSVAVKIMASMNLGDMLRGLTGMGLALVVIAGAMKLMPKGMVLQAAALMELAVAMNAMAVALKLFATLNWDQMARGLTALAGTLVVLAAAMRLMPKNMVLQAAALTILSVALNGMAVALKLFATFSWDAMAHGLTALAGALLIIAGAMNLMPSGPNLLIQSAALVVLSVALNSMALALKTMGGMTWEAIAKGLVTLGGALLILAGGLTLMSGTLSGSAALLVAAGALVLLTPVLVTLGSLEWSTIIKSMTALAAVFVILGVAGLALAPVTPVILGLGAAMVLMGAGLALAGVGALAFATAYATVVAAGAAGVTVLSGILKTFVTAIPGALKAFGLGIVELAKVLANAQPVFARAFGALISAILDAIIKNTPKIGTAFLTLINTGINVLNQAVPKIATAGLKLLLSLLTAINGNISRIIPVATSIIVKFIDGISAGLPRIIDSGVKLVINFINGLSKAIDAHSREVGEAGARLGVAIVKGMAEGIAGGLSVVTDAAKNLAKSALDTAKHFLGIHSPSREFIKVGEAVTQGFANGIVGSKDQITAAWGSMNDLLKSAMDASNKDIATAKANIASLTAARVKDGIAIKNASVDVTQAKDRLNELTSAHKQNQAAISAAQQAYDQARQKLADLTDKRNKDTAALNAQKTALTAATKEHAAESAAYTTLNQQLADEETQLQSLSTQYDDYTAKIKTAQDALDAATKSRDDYAASITTQYDALGTITKDTTLADYITGLQTKIADTSNFADALQHLKDLGLSDQVYKDLLTKGIDALPFVEELVKGGQASVDTINALSAQLGDVSQALGLTASQNLYQAGVDAAQGLVQGLQSQQAAIQAQMAQIAAEVQAVLAEKLKIKSPSRVMMALGGHIGSGLALGIKGSLPEVQKATDSIGQNTVDAMKRSIAMISGAVDLNMQLNPTITPILDLSDVKKGALGLGSILPSQKISVDVAYSSAKDASAGYRSNQEAAVAASEPTTPDVAPQSFTFVQNNTSPKALSTADIYRQTNNQLSKAKGALTR